MRHLIPADLLRTPYVAFRSSVALVIATLLTFGPYSDFVPYIAQLLRKDPLTIAVASCFTPLRVLCILLAVLIVAAPRLAFVWTPCLAATFGLFNWFCARVTPDLWSYNTHLNIFILAIALTEVVARERGAHEVDEAAAKRIRDLAIQFCQLYVALFYFQSGLSKLIHGGWEWMATGRTAWIFTLEMGTSLGMSLAHYPIIFAIGSTAIVAFEIAFLPLFLLNRIRGALVLGAAALHFTVWLVMDISFWHLWLLYPSLFWNDIQALRRRRALLRVATSP